MLCWIGVYSENNKKQTMEEKERKNDRKSAKWHRIYEMATDACDSMEWRYLQISICFSNIAKPLTLLMHIAQCRFGVGLGFPIYFNLKDLFSYNESSGSFLLWMFQLSCGFSIQFILLFFSFLQAPTLPSPFSYFGSNVFFFFTSIFFFSCKWNFS